MAQLDYVRFKTLISSGWAQHLGRLGVQKASNMTFGQQSVVGRFFTIQHCLNPLHVYCRLLDRGLSRRISTSLGKSYETLIWVWLSWIIKAVIYLFFAINRGCRSGGEARSR